MSNTSLKTDIKKYRYEKKHITFNFLFSNSPNL